MVRSVGKRLSINTRVSLELNQIIEDLVKQKNYDSVSEFIRVGIDMLIKYHNYEHKMEDKDYREKFLSEIKPELLMDKLQSAVSENVANLSDEDFEMFYYALSTQRLTRKRNAEYEKKKMIHCIRNGGELEARVGYKLGRTGSNGTAFEFYKPITPDWKEDWDNLSDDDRTILLEELKEKLEKMPERLGELGYKSELDPTTRLDYIINEISKSLESEF